MEKIISKQDKVYKNYILEKINEFNTNGKKTIVYFCDSYYPIIDGVVKVVENYAITMCQKFNIVLVVPKYKGKTVTEKKDYLVIGTKSKFFKILNYSLAFPKLDKFLSKMLKILHIDLVHGHSPFTMGNYASKLARKKKIPFVMTFHSQYKKDFMRYTKSKKITALLLRYIMRVFNKSTEVWTIHNTAKQVIKEYGYKGIVNLVPNATDFYIEQLKYSEEQLKQQINEKYTLSPDKVVFLFLGRLVAQKNIFFVVDTLSLLDQKGIDFKMFFVGNGPDENSLIKHIKNKNLQDKIVLTGRIDDKNELASYYARSDLFLFPSVYDTSSLVQIEASALHTPSVLLKDTATAQTITHGVNGYISGHSVEEYAQTIIDALNDKEKLQEISSNAHNDIYVTWKMLGEKIEQRYNSLFDSQLQNK